MDIVRVHDTHDTAVPSRVSLGVDYCTGCTFSHSQHEYQHQLEFTHDGSATDTVAISSGRVGSVGGAAGGRGAERGRGGGTTRSTISSANGTGTGARGRLLAVAADRRRAERSLQRGVGQDLLNTHGGDAREAQRTRWVMRMQNEVQQQAPAQPSAGKTRQEGAGQRGSSSSAASPSPFRVGQLHGGSSESAPPGTGRSNTVDPKRVSAWWLLKPCRSGGLSVVWGTLALVVLIKWRMIFPLLEACRSDDNYK